MATTSVFVLECIQGEYSDQTFETIGVYTSFDDAVYAGLKAGCLSSDYLDELCAQSGSWADVFERIKNDDKSVRVWSNSGEEISFDVFDGYVVRKLPLKTLGVRLGMPPTK